MGRGILSSLDAAWLCRQYAIKCLNNSKNILKDNEESILSVISERESIYRLLAQTKPENLNQNFSQYNLNPITRYPNLSSVTIMPHQCKHLIYSNVKRTIQQHKQTLAEKRLRRITIACTPETFKQQFIQKQEINEESPEDESSFNNNLLTNNKNNLNSNNDRINYDKNQIKLTGKEYLANNKQYLTPSAFNLASLEKSRNKELDMVIRHRKQREERLNQECLTSEERFMNHIRKQIKPKENWFLNNINNCNINTKQENSYESNTSSNKSNNSSQEDLTAHYNHFSSKVQDLEYKLSNHNQFNEERYLRNQNSSKHVDGVNVMVARLALQDLLDPIKQEEKFREEVKRKAFLEKDFNCKFVGKLTEDWNFKLFNSTSSEDNDKISTPSTTLSNKLDRSVSLKQRPKERLALFKDKLKNIENILTNGKSRTDDEVNRLTKKQLQQFEQKQSNGRCGEWIEKLKGELNDKLNDKPKPTRSFIKKRSSISQMNHSSSNQDTSTHSTNSYFKKPNVEYIKYEKMTKPTIKAIKPASNDYLNNSIGATNYHSLDRSTIDKLKQNKFDSFLRIETNRPTYMKDDCRRCNNKVLTVDKILINGSVFHRTCLNCVHCGVSLRLSEVRHTNNAIDDKNCVCTLCSNENRLTRSNSTSNYSDKLKERIKLKEIYLLNSSQPQQTQDAGNRNQINERIEYGYENTSLINHDLIDDEEVTKLLNLDTKDVCSKSSQSSIKSENSDEEEDEDEEESSSESTSTLDDQTTGADIYSDQFDASITEHNLPEIIVDKSTDNPNDSDSESKEQNETDDDEPTLNEAINELQDLTEIINFNDNQANDLHNQLNQLNEQKTNFNVNENFQIDKMISNINEVELLDEEDDLLLKSQSADEVKKTEKSNSIGNFNLKVEIPESLASSFSSHRDGYSKIPVLKDYNATKDSNPRLNKPSYGGSFTEKVLKCKSSPSLNDNFSFTSFYSNASSPSFKK